MGLIEAVVEFPEEAGDELALNGGLSAPNGFVGTIIALRLVDRDVADAED